MHCAALIERPIYRMPKASQVKMQLTCRRMYYDQLKPEFIFLGLCGVKLTPHPRRGTC